MYVEMVTAGSRKPPWKGRTGSPSLPSHWLEHECGGSTSHLRSRASHGNGTTHGWVWHSDTLACCVTVDGPPPDFLTQKEKWAFTVFKPQGGCFFYNSQFNLIWIHWSVFKWKKPFLRCVCPSKHHTFQTQLSSMVTYEKMLFVIWGWTVEITEVMGLFTTCL